MSRWLRFWFAPASPVNLAASRLVFFAGVFLVYCRDDLTAWGSVSPAFWMPMPLFAALHLRPLPPAALEVLQAVWHAALLFSAAGFLTRASTLVAFVLSFYLLGLPHNFGHVFHFDALLVIAMGVLACSRAGDALSVDAWLAQRERPAPSGEYTWPIRLIWVMMSLVFFAAGLAKLRYGGLAWVASSNMSIVLMRAVYHVSDADPLSGAGLWIARHAWMSQALAASALIVELGFIAALFSRAARAVLVPAAFAMLVGIRVLMGPTFGGFLLANAFWVPWDALAARVTSWLRAHPARRAAAIEPHARPSGAETTSTFRVID